jgi:hypothetical protein
VPLARGVVRRDANEIVPSREVFTYERGGGTGSIAAFSNLFRYRMINLTGMTWVDTDVLCLAADWPASPYRFAWESPAADRCNVAVLGAPAGDPLIEGALNSVLAVDRHAAEFGDLGPGVFTKTLVELGRSDLAGDHRLYYPMSHRECPMLLDPARRDELEARLRDSLAMHLWNEVWTRSRVPTFLRPPAGSYMEDVYARHGVVVPIEARIADPSVLIFRGDERVVPFEEYERLRRWALEMQAELLRRDE